MTTDTMTEMPISMPDSHADLIASLSDDVQPHNAAMIAPLEALLARAAALPEAAADLAYRCISVAETSQAPTNPDTIIALLARAANVCAGTLGKSHPAAGALRCQLGDLLLRERRAEEARQHYEIVLAAHRPSVLGDSALIARALSGLGDALRVERKYTAALICLQRALRRQSELHGASCDSANSHPPWRALV